MGWFDYFGNGWSWMFTRTNKICPRTMSRLGWVDSKDTVTRSHSIRKAFQKAQQGKLWGMGYSNRRPQHVPLLSDNNRHLKTQWTQKTSAGFGFCSLQFWWICSQCSLRHRFHDWQDWSLIWSSVLLEPNQPFLKHSSLALIIPCSLHLKFDMKITWGAYT